MGKKIRSAKGETVDFDVLKIKEQIAATPKPKTARQRQDFIERRLRRRLKKVTPPAPAITKEEDPKLPGTEELSETPKLIDEVVEEKVEEKPTTTRSRQKARPAKSTED